MSNTRLPEAIRNRFLYNNELLPSDMYPAAVGLFESMHDHYEYVGIAPNAEDRQAPEYARVYRARATGLFHIIYYPGRDVEFTKHGVTAFFLKQLTQPAHEALSKLISNSNLNMATKHFIIAQSGSYGPTFAKHYVYGCSQNNVTKIQDSKNPIFSYKTKKYIEGAIHPNEDGSGFLDVMSEPHVVEVIQHGLQLNKIDPPLCGHYSLQALRRNLANEPIPKLNVFQRNPLLKYFIFGAITVAGVALIAAGAAATFGILPAILIPVGFAVGGALAATGIIGGLISKFKKPAHNYHINAAHQEEHLGYYLRGTASISRDYSSSEARIRDSLSQGDLKRLAPVATEQKKPTEETRLVTTETDVHSNDDFDIPPPGIRQRESSCSIQ